MHSMISTRNRVPVGHHAARATTPWWRLLIKFGLRFRLQYLLDAPAVHSWLILRRKYDAFTTDYAYETRPTAWLGPLGAPAARRVMNYPLHVAMRERLAIVSQALVTAVNEQAGSEPVNDRAGRVRVLSAPAGLCRDLMVAAAALGERQAGVTWHALDIDAAGDVIPEARRRTTAAGLPVTFFREDLTDPTGLSRRTRQQPYDIINCIGLITWLNLAEVAQIVGLFRTALRPGGRLIIDNWAPHTQSQAGEDLEIFANYHDPAAIRATLTAAGFTIEHVATTSNGACTVYSASA